MESQIGDFYKDVGELGSLQGVCLPQRGLMAGDREGGEQSGMVETRIVRLIEPLKERRRILLASKEMHQVAQDLEDEIVSDPALPFHIHTLYSSFFFFNDKHETTQIQHTSTTKHTLNSTEIDKTIIDMNVHTTYLSTFNTCTINK